MLKRICPDLVIAIIYGSTLFTITLNKGFFFIFSITGWGSFAGKMKRFGKLENYLISSFLIKAFIYLYPHSAHTHTFTWFIWGPPTQNYLWHDSFIDLLNPFFPHRSSAFPFFPLFILLFYKLLKISPNKCFPFNLRLKSNSIHNIKPKKC